MRKQTAVDRAVRKQKAGIDKGIAKERKEINQAYREIYGGKLNWKKGY